MKRFYIITNDYKDVDQRITERIVNYLTEIGLEYIIAEKDEQGHILKDLVPKDMDCALVLGGDGTLIRAARDLEQFDLPLLGVNLGTLGYLTEVEVHEIESAIQSLIHDRYFVENRMMLSGRVNQQEAHSALNDIVIAREGYMRTVHFCIYVNGVLLNRYHADGVIVSTPTGSTGYNLSAGGPIVEPSAQMMVITPICPHGLNNGSIVLSSGDKIQVEIIADRHGHRENAAVSFDGASMESLVVGDIVSIERSNLVTKMIRIRRESFMNTLRKKFNQETYIQ